MIESMTSQEAAAVLGVMMIGADGANRPEELRSMLDNPFFKAHIAEHVPSPGAFLRDFNNAMGVLGESGLERKAIDAIKTAFPAFQLKTLAMLTLIAGANDDYHQNEKALMARAVTALRFTMDDVAPELEKMRAAVAEQNENQEDETDVDKDSSE